MTPQQLQRRVLESLLEEDGLDARHIRVVAIGNDIYLEGEVTTPEMYDLAERVAGTVGGVGDLTNNLVTTEVPYDIRDHRDGMDLRADPSTDATTGGRMEVRIGPFGEEWDEATPLEGETSGGPVGGDAGNPLHPMDVNEVAPLSIENFNAEEPWRYQTDGANTYIDEEPVLPPDEDEV